MTLPWLLLAFLTARTARRSFYLWRDWSWKRLPPGAGGRAFFHGPGERGRDGRRGEVIITTWEDSP